MAEGHLKITRYGRTVETIRYQRPFIHNHSPKRKNYSQRKQSQDTQKSLQSLWRARRNLRQKAEAATYIAGTPGIATFTFRPPRESGEPERPTSIADASKWWRKFTMRMNRVHPEVAFARVMERHKNGVVHIHALMWGLPQDLPCILKKRGYRWVHACPPDRRCERKRRESKYEFSLAREWGRGFVDVEIARSPEKSAAYMAKYISKSNPDPEFFQRRYFEGNKAFTDLVAQAREKGVYYGTSSFKIGYDAAVMLIHDIWANEASTLRKSEFDSKWLGHAHYDIYKLKEWPSDHRLNLIREDLSALYKPGNTGKQVPDPAHTQSDQPLA